MRSTLVSVSLIAFSLVVPSASLKTDIALELRNDMLEQKGKPSMSLADTAGKGRSIEYGFQCALLCVLLGAASWYLRNTQGSEAKKPVASTKSLSVEEQAKVEPPVLPSMSTSTCCPDDEEYDELALDEYLDTKRQQIELDESDDILDNLLNVAQDTLDDEFRKIMPQQQPLAPSTDNLDTVIEGQLETEIRAKLHPAQCKDYEAALDAYLDTQRQQEESEESDEILAQLLKLSQDNIDAEFEEELAPGLAVRPASPRPCPDRVEESIEALLASELEAQLHPAAWMEEEEQ